MSVLERPLSQTSPVFIPSPECTVRAYTLPANTTNVRQLVIRKQNGRVVAAKSQLIDRMEDALVRWRPPASCHAGSTAALKGKHPYQQELDTDVDLTSVALHTSLDSIRHYFDNLGHTASRSLSQRPPKTELLAGSTQSQKSSSASSASGMAVQIRRSVQSAGTHGTTPRATAYDVDPKNIEAEPASYSFPIPVYYLPHPDVRPVGESTRENNEETHGCWGQWTIFWEELRDDLATLCSCN
ncbi:LAQU0S08e02190g1_1 [Lachancea quebecensis]|uniref:LAQU0S08e02190g1_1 n=1 Tax=Lachancea quebecensis TaxID=1654605 RepID=A0A0P1KSD5_9SACH|nr:LAQU0S08e02190g1_1 [Lachancea quebecensis]